MAEVNFTFEGQGDYFQLKELIGDLVNVRRWTGINQYWLGVQEEKKRRTGMGEEKLVLGINGKFYYWRQQ